MARAGIVVYHGIRSGPELTEYGRIAEDAGLDSVWVTERYFHEETFSLLGYLAAATQRPKLGLAVANPYTRSPALLAMASATLDRLSGGRFVLGLGRSDRSVVEGRLGIPYGEPRAALEEAVRVVRDLTSGRTVTRRDARSTMDSVRLAVSPVQQKLPIYLAAIGPRALRLAGTIADGVLLNAYSPVEYVRYAVGEVRDAARRAGRDPSSIDVACMLVMRPTGSPEGIWPSLKERIARLLSEKHVGEVLLERGGFDPSVLGPLRAAPAEDGGARLVTDDMVEAFYLVGPATRLAERVKEYQEAGVQLPLLLPRLGDFKEVAELVGTFG